MHLNDPEAFHGVGASAKAKVYCKKHFDMHVAEVRAEDDRAVHRGQRTSPRTLDAIEDYRMYN